MGAAIPRSGLLAFRSYLYRSDGYDRGHQVVALYGHTDMELRALFLGRLVSNLRTGAAITAALHLVEPSLRDIGIVGTGHQARNAVACIATMFRAPRVIAWSPNLTRRTSFSIWAREALGVDVETPESAHDLLERTSHVVLATAAESPVVTPAMLPEPRLLVSISSYRRAEIDTALLDAARVVWTDSVAQASGPGTLFESEERRSKLRPLMQGLRDGSLRDESSHRIILNTGAAWEEAVTAQLLYELATEKGVGTEIALPAESAQSSIF